MGYTILDCFLCAFSSRADNSLSKKDKMFVQLNFHVQYCTGGSKMLVLTAFFVAVHKNKKIST